MATDGPSEVASAPPDGMDDTVAVGVGDDEARREEAATRIQAVARGRLTRRQLATGHASAEHMAAGATEDARSSSLLVQGDEERRDGGGEGKDDSSDESKVQAGVPGAVDADGDVTMAAPDDVGLAGDHAGGGDDRGGDDIAARRRPNAAIPLTNPDDDDVEHGLGAGGGAEAPDRPMGGSACARRRGRKCFVGTIGVGVLLLVIGAASGVGALTTAGILLVAITTVIPALGMLVFYVWRRAFYDPCRPRTDGKGRSFAAEDDAGLVGVALANMFRMAATCPPSVKSLPTQLYLIIVLLCFLSLSFSRPSEPGQEPNVWANVFYNGFGSLLIAVASVLFADLIFLVIEGATRLWYLRRRISAGDDGADRAGDASAAAAGSGGGGRAGDFDAHNRAGDDEDDGIELGATTPLRGDLPASTPVGLEVRRDAVTRPWEHLPLSQRRGLSKLLHYLRVGRGTLVVILWLSFVIKGAVDAYGGEPHLIEFEVALRNLPACADGYKFGLLTDVHVGQTVGPSEVQAQLELMNAFNLDAIFVVGDLVDMPVEVIGPNVDAFSAMGTDTPDGVFFTTGNHEQISGTRDAWVARIRDNMNWTTLENQRVRLGTHMSGQTCTGFDLAGINDKGDPAPHQPDLQVAIAGRNPDDALVLMAHQPSQAESSSVSDNGVGLQLSGHTHGGQIWPAHFVTYLTHAPHFAGMVYVPPTGPDGRPADGEDDNGGTYVYTSEGAIGWGPRLRFLSTPEHTVVTLRSPEVIAAEATTEDERDAAIEEYNEPLLVMRAATFWALVSLWAMPIAIVLCVCYELPRPCKERMRHSAPCGALQRLATVGAAPPPRKTARDEV